MSTTVRLIKGGKKDKLGLLSNYAPISFLLHGVWWKSVEHYYQAHKTTDIHQWRDVIYAKGASSAHALGQSITLRDNWDVVKFQVMAEAMAAKFTQSAIAAAQLVSTNDDMLVEDSDNAYWGGVLEGSKNKVGQMLMAIRTNLQGAANAVELDPSACNAD